MFTRGSSIDLGLNRAVESLLRSGGSEGILPIVQVGEPVLRQPTRRYNGQLSKSTLTKLVETMRTTMVEAPGVGLAAPQIGLGLALAVVEDHISDDLDDPREISEFPFHAIINPSYQPIGTETRSFYEGCLSFEGYQAVRKRWRDITARWQDMDGTWHELPMADAPSHILSDEYANRSGDQGFTGCFATLCCQDQTGEGWPADFRYLTLT